MATFDESFVGRIPARVALSAIQMSTAGLDHCPRGGLSGQIAVRFLAWRERRHTARASDEIRVWRNAKLAFSAPRHELQAVWSEVSYQIALRRDDGACVQEEFESLKDASAPGLSMSFSFDIPTDRKSVV